MAVKTDVKLSNISYVIVYVQDTEKALPFYRDKLGMKVKQAEPGWVELETGHTTLALHSLEKGHKHPGKIDGLPVVVFNVDNIYDSRDALKQRGVEFKDEPKVVCEAGDHEGMCTNFYDPDGNLYSLFAMQPKKK
ncbi:MAG TPA: VOC family protein [Candidatus Obscuribacterales bacterium]